MTKTTIRVSFGRQLRAGTALAMVTLVAGVGGAAMAGTSTGGEAAVSTRNAKAGDAAVATIQDSTNAPSAGTQAGTPAAKPSSSDSTVVIITGTRSSQRSSIDIKKKAKTATDAIVAEDIGQFPDKDIDEAISRVAGIQLDRGQFGEGQGVAVRGDGPDQTHVEMDGVSVMNTSGGLVNGQGAGSPQRGADMRELPADIVKSIEVIKGTTAAMTEGSLGGSINITTRTGLDFKKPFMSFNFDEQMDTLSKRWRPEYSLIVANKFLGGRLGVVADVNYSEIQTDSDQEQPNTSGSSGYFRSVDLDNSTSKTFTFNPAVSAQDGSSNQVITNSVFTPEQVITQSANAKTKSDCLADFPAFTPTQLAGFGSSATTQNNFQVERASELQTCLNQWNDYTPSLIRLLSSNNYERRLQADIRFDYRINDDLTVYFKAAMANRNANQVQNTLSLGSPGFNTTAMIAPFASGVNSVTTMPTVLAPTTGITQPYAVYPNGVGGAVVSDITASTVDASHHATSVTINDANVNVDQNQQYLKIGTYALQWGAHYHHDNVKLDVLASSSGSTFLSESLRGSVNFTYGTVTMTEGANGLWNYSLPSNINFMDASQYAVAKTQTAALKAVAATNTAPAAPAYTVAQEAQLGNAYSLTWRPLEQADRENMIKADLTYDLEGKVPFFTDIIGGIQARNHVGDGYSGGGETIQTGTGTIGTAGYVAPIVVPTNNNSTIFRSCLPTATSTMPCDYGFVPASALINNVPYPSLTNALQGVMTFTPTDLASAIQSALYMHNGFMNGYPNRGTIMSSIPELNIDQLAKSIPHATFNMDCMKYCTANNGQVYQQPHAQYLENTTALYLMTDFEYKLPWGMVFNGNAGDRYIRTYTNATGVMTFTHVALASNYDPVTNPNVTGASTSITVNTTINGVTNDWTPSYNLNLWVTPDLVLRYYSGHVIARPPVSQLLPAGTCTIDDRNNVLAADGNGTQTCSTVGNPNLKPYTAINHNETVEWYPNKDTEVSLGYYYNNIIVNGPIGAFLTAQDLFAASSGGKAPVDPVTGQSLAGVNFSYASYVNGPPGLQRGIEFATKLAFTRLPWFLKYTGMDFNYSKLGFKSATPAAIDQISGNALPPANQAGYFENWALWFDNGALNIRVAYQGRDQLFSCIASCGANTVNDVPGPGLTTGQTIRAPYNPGFPNYTEKTQFVDVKINYKISKDLEVYALGRNVLDATTSATNQGPYGTNSAGAPSIENLNYAGARYEVGFTIRR